ncbi:TPM domain-containing protein [uncultured Shimia sp.]|uniref:TPM domain-containing protein n=1 Tax=uncultured Shimia sp. TaxID=573152 RepID=UPI00263A184A|nr:TPM domain-containing protein [uncultured Shimia sp.]
MRQLIKTLILIVALPVANLATAQQYPDYTELYVNDFADLLPAEDEDRIRQKLIELREKRDIEFTVVTIRSMQDYGHDGEIEPFATGLFNTWGVGDASRNDGVVMLIALEDRVMRIEVGSGYGTVKNVPMGNIIDTKITPRFKKSDYVGGIEHGVDAVIKEITGSWPGEYDASAMQKIGGALKKFLDWVGNWIYALLAPVAALGAKAAQRWRRNKPRICPVDCTKMVKLDEVWDDQHLEKGEITEERLKSVDYDVWTCERCEHVTVEAYKSWFSSYGACRSCGYRTVQGDTTIITAATTSSTGLKRIDYTCHNCGDKWSGTRTIPRKSSSSSSSGGSSFGGGSSSGGGSSGSW